MRVLVTGATGFIGSAVVAELLDSGHEVIGLARSNDGLAAVENAGAQPRRGELEDLDGLRAAAGEADGVIHTAFIHNFTRMAQSVEVERRAVEALGGALAGSGRPLVVTTGVAAIQVGRPTTEEDTADPATHPRLVTEALAREFAGRGVRTATVRPGASVHGEGDQGFVPYLIGVARKKGVSGYIGDGSNRWPAVHRLDAARLYRLALEQAPAGSVWHAVAEDVPARDIAEVIGRHLEVPVVSIAPEDAPGHFDWMARFWGFDAPASSALTQERLGWRPEQRGLIADLEAGHYFVAQPAGLAA